MVSFLHLALNLLSADAAQGCLLDAAARHNMTTTSAPPLPPLILGLHFHLRFVYDNHSLYILRELLVERYHDIALAIAVDVIDGLLYLGVLLQLHGGLVVRVRQGIGPRMSHSSGTTTTTAGATTSSSGSTISGTGKLRQFVCIEYPGLVENVDNMINTLGGLEKISECKLGFHMCLVRKPPLTCLSLPPLSMNIHCGTQQVDVAGAEELVEGRSRELGTEQLQDL
ncbi:hypothetical protein E2C01_020387 [Portunus trituberculatus]|uniref:Transcription factor IIIC subunit Tfc1/Sfc1 triple barrel domain-containing protein n=1 Tax=Portunus trituberculatus TaxID=210409 RepID=A0A5B7E1D7_PORTR|nr:hypothetical protein [Portunus trituberculatus]